MLEQAAVIMPLNKKCNGATKVKHPFANNQT